jgi:SAM-dependent methyltransferase
VVPDTKAFNRIGQYYDRLVERYGHDHRACDYGRAESQRLKFEILSGVTPLNGKSVLDVGCGFADFSDYLNVCSAGINYVGLDLSAEMVRAARELHPNLDIRQMNILEEDPGRFDVVTANGIFYLLGTDAQPLMRALIERMFECANEALAFNSLSGLASQKETGEFYADPGEVLNFCLTLSPRAVLRNDYLRHDFTIYLYKDRT